MRRKDREMGQEFALDLIERCDYGIMSLITESGEPYGVPLSVVRGGDVFYFHSARGGKKVEALAVNNAVCITFVGAVEVTNLYSDERLKELFSNPEGVAKHISSVFTTEFESAMLFGKAELVSEKEEKVEAMRLICEKYTPDKMEYFDLAIETSYDRINVYRVVAERITAKRKKYDDSGVEMKWQRE